MGGREYVQPEAPQYQAGNQAERPSYPPEQPEYQQERREYQPDGPNYKPETQPNYQQERPTYEPERPANYQPERADYQPDRPEYQPERPNYQAERPNYQPERPDYQPDRPNYHPQRPNYQPEPTKPSTYRDGYGDPRPAYDPAYQPTYPAERTYEGGAGGSFMGSICKTKDGYYKYYEHGQYVGEVSEQDAMKLGVHIPICDDNAELRREFEALDTNGDGKISIDEYKAARRMDNEHGQGGGYGKPSAYGQTTYNQPAPYGGQNSNTGGGYARDAYESQGGYRQSPPAGGNYGNQPAKYEQGYRAPTYEF